jgi:hypothetical protein
MIKIKIRFNRRQSQFGPVCALRYSLAAKLVNQTNYQTHTPSVHPTFASPTLFEIKLSCGKLVTSAFQHMGIICGARKSFLEFSLRLRIPSEPFDLQQETSSAGSIDAALFTCGNGSYNLRKERLNRDYALFYLTNLLMNCNEHP